MKSLAYPPKVEEHPLVMEFEAQCDQALLAMSASLDALKRAEEEHAALNTPTVHTLERVGALNIDLASRRTEVDTELQRAEALYKERIADYERLCATRPGIVTGAKAEIAEQLTQLLEDITVEFMSTVQRLEQLNIEVDRIRAYRVLDSAKVSKRLGFITIFNGLVAKEFGHKRGTK